MELVEILNNYNNSIFLAGALGALLADLLKDNALELPKRIDGKMCLGFVGGMIAGGFAGIFIDGSLETAFMGGYVGKEILAKILAKKLVYFNEIEPETKPKIVEKPPVNETIEQLIRRIARKNEVDEELAVAVARCESGLKKDAINTNTTGTKDRGLYQWNNYFHPEITDQMAYDPEIACQKFCEAVNAGHLSWWAASVACWNKEGKYIM